MNIRYEYDIPDNPNVDPNEPKIFDPETLKGTFQDSNGSMSLGFLKSSELTGQKRSQKFYQKQR